MEEVYWGYFAIEVWRYLKVCPGMEQKHWGDIVIHSTPQKYSYII